MSDEWKVSGFLVRRRRYPVFRVDAAIAMSESEDPPPLETEERVELIWLREGGVPFPTIPQMLDALRTAEANLLRRPYWWCGIPRTGDRLFGSEIA